jgi:uncharacterized pyridoxamine 5'-phosphate oxidase family protein
MKKLIILFTFFVAVLTTTAQNKASDEVYPADGDIPYRKCQILEIKDNNVIVFKFKKETLEVEAISIKKDGKYIDLSAFVKEPNPQELIETIEEEPILEDDFDEDTPNYIRNRKNAYSAFGVGLGNAYGGLGFQFQFRDGYNFGIGGHIGGGIIPRIGEMSKIMFGFNAGVKVYVYRPVFLDLTFGVVGASSYGVLLGPSVKAGADLFFSNTVGINLAGGLSFFAGEFAPTLDFGLLFKLPGRKTKKSHKLNN